MKPELPRHADPRKELSDWQLWLARGIVIAVASLAGLTVVGFTWVTDRAFDLFLDVSEAHWWIPLAWTPLSAAGIVWLTRRHFKGAAGSGIPQVMAALDPSVNLSARLTFVSLRLTAGKIALSAWGLLAGLSLGREGPSVQVAAGVMHSARGWLPRRAAISDHSLLVAGGAAGIAAAFNTPLAGVMFAIEELSRRPEQRNNGLIMTAIVIAGLMAVSAYGNGTYFAAALIALGMTAFLSAATQAPLTSFIIVMEMVDGHAMELRLMACALIASGISRLLTRRLYQTLAQRHVDKLPIPATPPLAG